MTDEPASLSTVSGGTRISSYTLDNIFGHNLSQLSNCDPPDIAEVSPLNLFLLGRHSSAGDGGLLPAGHLLFRHFISCTIFAVDEYRESCKLLREYISRRDSPPVSTYLRAVLRFQSCIIQATAAQSTIAEFGKINKERLFEDKDGSPYQRLNELSNCVRHFHGYIIPLGRESKLDNYPIVPIWITNEGVMGHRHGSDFGVTFVELSNLLKETSSLVEKIVSGDLAEEVARGDGLGKPD